MTIVEDALVTGTVSALDVESLPRGKKSRLSIELVHDGLGRAISLPVMVARGERPGPIFGVTAAVHGNELNGIPVIHRLFERFDPMKLRGTVVGVVGVNLPGMLENRRDIADGMDLNRIMPGKETGDIAEIFAYRFIQRVVRHFDYLVDLHTASAGRMNSLYVRADLNADITAQMAYLIRPQIVVHNPASDGTLRGAAEELGIPAITVEIGNPNRFQPEYIKSSLVGIRSVLAQAGILPRRTMAPRPLPIVCERSYWLYSDHGGFLEVDPKVTDHVEKDQVVARLSNVYGDVVRQYKAPEAGVVIGKSVAPVGQSGARILHLGIVKRAATDLVESDDDTLLADLGD